MMSDIWNALNKYRLLFILLLLLLEEGRVIFMFVQNVQYVVSILEFTVFTTEVVLPSSNPCLVLPRVGKDSIHYL
jgi:hypothetical protein